MCDLVALLGSVVELWVYCSLNLFVLKTHSQKTCLLRVPRYDSKPPDHETLDPKALKALRKRVARSGCR